MGAGTLLSWLMLTVVGHLAPRGAQSQALDEHVSVVQCDVVVIGGSVAGLSAAVTAAKEGAEVCLLEPTDMLGGQMTANGDGPSARLFS